MALLHTFTQLLQKCVKVTFTKTGKLLHTFVKVVKL